MPHHQANPKPHREMSSAEVLLEVINDANRIFGERHNWLSPATTEQDRQQFISRCCDWWNYFVCPAMDRFGAVWNEERQRFEIAENNDSTFSQDA